MARASYMQTNFLGGVWSKYFQGRVDHPQYKAAMNVCLNGYPIEEGAWLRRSGTRLMAPTFKGLPGRLYPLEFTTSAPYQTEWTDDGTHGYLRFFNGVFPVVTEEVNYMAGLSTAKPAVLTLASPVSGWATGDEIAFIAPPGLPGSTIPQLRQRTFLITTQALGTPTAWSSTTNYAPGDTVSDSGVNYICILLNTNQEPPNATYWDVIPAGSIQSMTLADSITGLPLDGSTVTMGVVASVAVMRALRVSSPFTNGSWETLRIVQNQDLALVLHGSVTPQTLTVNPNIGSNQAANASLVAARFLDGPYLDPIPGSNVTASGTNGIIGVTVNFQAYVAGTTYMEGDYVSSGGFAYQSVSGGNIGNTPPNATYWTPVAAGLAVTGDPNADPATFGFQTTDVGRQMRLLCTPTPWQAGTYVVGNVVYWNLLAYTCTTNGTTTQPDLDPIGWNVSPAGLYWTWGTITTVINDHEVDLQVQGNPILYSGVTIQTWRFGVYSQTTGYPTCGFFAQGRFWLGGAKPNRFDATMSNGALLDGRIQMSPTGPGAANVTVQLVDDGSVNDNNGISYTLESKDKNPIFWFDTDKAGLIIGTLGGEWLVSSTNGSDPITPLNIQCNRVSKYGCADIEPKRTGIALVIVQKFKRRILEFLSDVFTGKYVAPHLTETAKNLTDKFVQEIGYQEELAPIIWARVNGCAGEGNLIGATYRRVSAFTTEAPKFVGWHEHTLGTDRCVESISVGSNAEGTLDALAMVTGDPLLESSQGLTTQVRWVEQMTQMFDEEDSIYNAWFLDGAIVPDTMYPDTVAGADGQRFTGLWQFQGMTVTLFAAGLDLGEYAVDANGTIFVPYGSGVQPATINYCASGSGKWKFTAAYITFILGLMLPNRSPIASSTVPTTVTPPTITPSTNPNASGSIQSYVAAHSQGVLSTRTAIDWGGGWLISEYSNSEGLTAFSLATGVDTARKDYTSVGGINSSGLGSDQKGTLYHTVNSGNYVPLVATTEATMTDLYSAGSTSTGGPPNNPGVPYGGDIMVLVANSEWVISCQSGASITLSQGTSGAFFGGNNSTQPNYMGLGLQPWQFTHNNTSMAPGAPTYQNNVATGYALNYLDDNNHSGTDVWAIGVADGVPTTAVNTINGGKKGKGKTKKGAGVGQTPSTDAPQKLFYKLGTIHAPDIDPYWADTMGCNINHCVIDQFDNSILSHAHIAADGLSAYSSAALYNFNPAPTSANPLIQWSNTATYTTGQIVTDGTNAYKAAQAVPAGTLLSNATYWTSVSTVTNPTGYKAFCVVTEAPNNYICTQDNTIGIDPATNNGCINDVPQKPWMKMQLNYIFKYQTGQASRTNNGPLGIAWVVPVNAKLSNTGTNQGQVKGGLYGYLSWTSDASNATDGKDMFPCYLIDTVTGNWYAVDVSGLSNLGGPSSTAFQCWDDQSESVVFVGSYLSTASGAPTALNSTVSTTGDYLRLFVGGNLPGAAAATLAPHTSACANALVSPTLTQPPTPKTFVFPDTIFGPGVFGACNASGGFPAVVGKGYTSQGQILRKVDPQEAGSRIGPAFGVTRRTHYWTALLHNTIQMQYGVDFGASLTCMTLKDGQDGNVGNQLMPAELFGGFVRYPLKDGYSYDSMLSWQITRPFPATLIAVGGMLETNDV